MEGPNETDFIVHRREPSVISQLHFHTHWKINLHLQPNYFYPIKSGWSSLHSLTHIIRTICITKPKNQVAGETQKKHTNWLKEFIQRSKFSKSENLFSNHWKKIIYFIIIIQIISIVFEWGMELKKQLEKNDIRRNISKQKN
jgi:hypothetical protein